MSLLDQYMTRFSVQTQTETPDGRGGHTLTLQDGDIFDATLIQDASNQQTPADKQTAHSTYTLTTIKAVTLLYGDIIKRINDGALFKIISDHERKTPPSATLDMKQCRAEECEAPHND